MKTLLMGTFFTSGAAMFSLHQHPLMPAKTAALTPIPVHTVAPAPRPPVEHMKRHPAKSPMRAAHAAPVKKAVVAAPVKAPAPAAKPKHKPYFFHSTKPANS